MSFRLCDRADNILLFSDSQQLGKIYLFMSFILKILTQDHRPPFLNWLFVKNANIVRIWFCSFDTIELNVCKTILFFTVDVFKFTNM